MKDLTNQTFGRLHVIEPTEKRDGTNIIWKCECICGNIVYVRGSSLGNGHTQSCGCLHKEINSDIGKKSAIDLTKQHFGKLTAIKPTDKRDASNCIIWECKCDCGNTAFVSSNHLLTAHTRSCGCFKKEQITKANLKDLSGKTFGRLTVSKRTGNRNSRAVVWICDCSCGNTVSVRGGCLKSGNTKSCGCLQKEQASKRFTIHGLSKTKQYIAMKTRNRREQQRIHDTEWTLEMETALREFQSSCVICGSTENLEIDHVLPLSKGFGIKPGNAAILCHYHNSVKNNRDLKNLPLDWQASLIWNAFKFKDHWMKLQSLNN